MSLHYQDSPETATKIPKLPISPKEIEANLSYNDEQKGNSFPHQKNLIFMKTGDSYAPSSEETDNGVTSENNISDNISLSSDDANDDILPNIT